MPKIYLETKIKAPIHVVFDLARSIDLHKVSAAKTNEEAVAGRTTGLIALGETVTWRAKHLGIYQRLTVKIIALERPLSFTDVMLKGAFRSMKHTHNFKTFDAGTKMTDIFEFESLPGIVGKTINTLFLKNYMTKFLVNKNKILKKVAENNEWSSRILKNENN